MNLNLITVHVGYDAYGTNDPELQQQVAAAIQRKLIGARLTNVLGTREVRIKSVTAAEEFSGVDTAPNDPRHVEQVLDHIAHLDEAQVAAIREELNRWEAAARAREMPCQCHGWALATHTNPLCPVLRTQNAAGQS